MSNGTTYYYVVTASDGDAQRVGYSGEAAASPAGARGGGDATVWINEFHYDNDGTDTGEFFEIAGTAGTEPQRLVGGGLQRQRRRGLRHRSADRHAARRSMGGFGMLSFAMVGMQNGSPDGLALVDVAGAVVSSSATRA